MKGYLLMKTYFNGINVPVLVPCKADGKIDEEKFCRHIKFLEASGVSGIFVGGTTGEFINFSESERQRQLELAVQNADGLNILYNVTAMNTGELKRHIKHALTNGVECVSLTAPYYHKYDRAAILDYFELVSKLSEGSAMVVYNMPGMTGNAITADMLPEMVKRCPNLKGIKDSSMNFTNLQELKIAVPEEFEVITGNDAEILPSLQLGCKGAIVALANVVPEICVGVNSAYEAGNLAAARRYQDVLITLRKTCRATVPVMSHKYLLELRGMPMGEPRFPMRRLTENECAILEKAFEPAMAILGI